MECIPTKRLKVKEIDISIEIDRLDTNVDLIIVVNNTRVNFFSKRLEYCENVEDEIHNDCVARNSQNLTTAGHAVTFVENFDLEQIALNSNIFVDALESIPVLRKKCARLGIKGNFDYPMTNDQEQCDEVNVKPFGQYEIETILDHDTVEHLYLVKWKGYDAELNTWEPVDHFGSNSNLLTDFRLMERRLSDDNIVAYKKIILLNCLLDEIMSPANQDPYILLNLNGKSASSYSPGDLWLLKRELKLNSMSLKMCRTDNQNKFRLNYEDILENAMKKLRIIVAFGSIEKLQEVCTHRKRFFNCMKFAEKHINRTIIEEGGSAPIEIENNCDFDLPPNDFTYITKCRPGPDVILSESPKWFCHCGSDCLSRTTCCPSINDSKHMYNRHGCLKSTRQTTIFECNSKCKCPSTCSNRVIQNSRKVCVSTSFIDIYFETEPV